MSLVNFATRSLGVNLYPKQAEVLDDWESSGRRTAILFWGRQSGKGLASDIVTLYEALIPQYPGRRAGETRYVLIVCTNETQSRRHILDIKNMMQAAPDPDIANLVGLSVFKADEIELPNGVIIRAMPCSARSIRGYTAPTVVLDELAFYVDTEYGNSAGQEILRGIEPTLATFPNGKLFVTSTPRFQMGAFYELVKRAENGDPDVFLSRLPTTEVNPTVLKAWVAKRIEEDPEGNAAEYLCEWLESGGPYLDPLAIYRAVVDGRMELPPQKGTLYRAAADPGFRIDGFGFTIAHLDRDKVVVDVMKSWHGKESPLSSDWALDEIARYCHAYDIESITSDQFNSATISDQLRHRNLMMRYEPLTNQRKLDVFTALKRYLNTNRLELLDDRALESELLHLEMRATPSGLAKIQARTGFHDDRAMVLATVVHELTAGIDPHRAVMAGSKGFALAQEWVDFEDKLNEERERERATERQVTIKQTSRQQAEAAMHRAA